MRNNIFDLEIKTLYCVYIINYILVITTQIVLRARVSHAVNLAADKCIHRIALNTGDTHVAGKLYYRETGYTIKKRGEIRSKRFYTWIQGGRSPEFTR